MAAYIQREALLTGLREDGLSDEEGNALSRQATRAEKRCKAAYEPVRAEWTHEQRWPTDGRQTPEGWAWRQAMALGAIDEDTDEIIGPDEAAALGQRLTTNAVAHSQETPAEGDTP